MRKYYLIITFLFVSISSFSQDIIGDWNFFSILPETMETGENLKPISEGDAMQINEDGSFHYEIAHADLIAEGSWELNENLLSFNYTLPKEMTRIYQVSVSENSLVLNESSINYAFTKSEIIPEVIVTSGITINSISRGILGIVSLLLIAFLFSRNRKGIDWMLVAKGLGIQIIFAIFILKVSIVSSSFEFVGKIFTKIISFTQDGTMFLFRSFETGTIESPLMNFVVMILPTVIFFSALTSLFYYWRIIPKIVYGFAWLMKSTMGLSGPESVAAAGNIFLGQTESPLLVKPYLDKMTMSEMMCLMSGGMATIAGGVLAAYIGFLGGDDPVQQIMFAKHLLAASVMSAPAAVV
ncbi:MAG: Na+ dependent nucleoside transporter, partial [Flavobacteriales bacterium]|nr:Na+ dependent nucleoside transporter [Flavobacteriales bacterium]